MSKTDEGLPPGGGLQHGRVLLGQQADQRCSQKKRNIPERFRSGEFWDQYYKTLFAVIELP